MKHLKLFDSFNLIQEGSITFSETEEIFYPMYDYGLKIDDVFAANFLSLPDDVQYTNNHEELKGPSYPGLSIRLRNKDIRVNDSFFDDLKDAIHHFESRCDCKLSNIYFRTPNGYWFRNVDVLKNHLQQQRNDERNFRMLLFIDIAFKFNDSVKTFWTTDEDGHILNIKNK